MTSHDRPRTIVYLAATEAAAREDATALERVPSGPDRVVETLPTDAIDRLRAWAPEVDCVVFAETPTSAAGATLLEAVEACGDTPLVLVTDASYAPAAARSTDGIDGYVRAGSADAIVHLADEIEWACAGADTEADDDAERDTETDSDARTVASGDAPAIEAGNATATTDAIPAPAGDVETAETDPAARLLETAPDVVDCEDRESLFDLLVSVAADAVEADGCWLSTVHFGELTPREAAAGVGLEELPSRPREGVRDDLLRTDESLLIDDLAADDRFDCPLEDARSLCCVPIGDAGLLHVTADDPGAFDEGDAELLAAWGQVGGAVLERLETEAGLRNDRERRQRELDRLAGRQDALAAERDRARSRFASLPAPAVAFDLADSRPIVSAATDGFRERFGLEDGAVAGEPLDELVDLEPGPIVAAVADGERRQRRCRLETDRGVREFQATLVPIEATAGDGVDRTPTGLLVYDDVTAATRHERARTAAEKRLEAIGDLLEEEIKPPLNVARGYLEVAEATGDAEHFAEIEDAQDQLLDRLERLAGIATRHEASVETEAVALRDVARRAWVAVDADDARLLTRDEAVLEANEARLRSVLEHLLRTALESATTAGSEAGDPVVTVGTTRHGFYVTAASGSESGAGAPAPERLTAADGTGFGLGPAERIVNAHGWELGVAADGTGFVVRGVDPMPVEPQ